jgi:hypothetical protein
MRPPATTRRGFLRLAGATAAFTTLARIRAVPAATVAPSGDSLFSPAERESLTQVVERLVDTGEAGAPRVRDTGTIASIERLLDGLPSEATAPLPWLLRAVEYAPLVFELRLARFSSLDDAGRDASLRGWAESRFALRRSAFLALRNLAFLGYYSQDATWQSIGYQGPLLPRRPAP